MPNGFDNLLEEWAEDATIATFEFTKSMYTSEKGHLTKVLGFGGKACVDTQVVDICGSARTDNNSKRELNLEEYVCIEYIAPRGEEGYEHLAPPVYFVATPYSEKPSYLTFTVDTKGEDENIKVRINVFSWDSEGRPLPNVLFNWHCCIRHVIVGIT